MHKELISFIEICLRDGVITEKERTVILRKAEEYGVPQDECEVILDSMLYQKISGSENKTLRIQVPEITNRKFKEKKIRKLKNPDFNSKLRELKDFLNEKITAKKTLNTNLQIIDATITQQKNDLKEIRNKTIQKIKEDFTKKIKLVKEGDEVQVGPKTLKVKNIITSEQDLTSFKKISGEILKSRKVINKKNEGLGNKTSFWGGKPKEIFKPLWNQLRFGKDSGDKGMGIIPAAIAMGFILFILGPIIIIGILLFLGLWLLVYLGRLDSSIPNFNPKLPHPIFTTYNYFIKGYETEVDISNELFTGGSKGKTKMSAYIASKSIHGFEFLTSPVRNSIIAEQIKEWGQPIKHIITENVNSCDYMIVVWSEKYLILEFKYTITSKKIDYVKSWFTLNQFTKSYGLYFHSYTTVEHVIYDDCMQLFSEDKKTPLLNDLGLSKELIASEKRKKILEKNIDVILEKINTINASINIGERLAKLPNQGIGSVYFYNELNKKSNLYSSSGHLDNIERFYSLIENIEKRYRKVYLKSAKNFFSNPSLPIYDECFEIINKLYYCYRLSIGLIEEIDRDKILYTRIYNKLEDQGVFLSKIEILKIEQLISISSELGSISKELKDLNASALNINSSIEDISVELMCLNSTCWEIESNTMK